MLAYKYETKLPIYTVAASNLSDEDLTSIAEVARVADVLSQVCLSSHQPNHQHLPTSLAVSARNIFITNHQIHHHQQQQHHHCQVTYLFPRLSQLSPGHLMHIFSSLGINIILYLTTSSNYLSSGRSSAELAARRLRRLASLVER